METWRKFRSFLDRENSSVYGKTRRTFTYGMCIGLPLLAIYQIGLPFINAGQEADQWIVNGAYLMMQRAVSLFGYLPFSNGTCDAIMIATVLIAIGYEKSLVGKIEIDPIFFFFTIGEAFALSLIIGTVVGWLTNFFLWVPQVLSVTDPSGVRELTAPLSTYLLQSCGDGFFEELLFRVIGVGGLIALLGLLKIPRLWCIILATIIVSAGFSYVHYLSPVLQESFAWDSFIRRSLLGVFLSMIYLWRGFGTAAWTHAFINMTIYTTAFLAGG